MGVRRRSLVSRNSSHWDGSCFRCKLVSLTSHHSMPSNEESTGSSISQSDSSYHQPSRTSPGNSLLFSAFFALEQQLKRSSRILRQPARLWKKSKSCSRKEDHILGRPSQGIVCWMRRSWNCNVLGRLVLEELLAGPKKKKSSIWRSMARMGRVPMVRMMLVIALLHKVLRLLLDLGFWVVWVLG